MSTEARLTAVEKATALVDEALAVLDAARVKNERVHGALRKARTECNTHMHELTHINRQHKERVRECRRSTSL